MNRKIRKCYGGELEGGELYGGINPLLAVAPLVLDVIGSIFGGQLEGGKSGVGPYANVYKSIRGNYRPRSLGSMVTAGAGFFDSPEQAERMKRTGQALRKMFGKKRGSGLSGIINPKGGYGTKSGASKNEWVEYVKQYAAENDLDYKDALIEAGPSYRELKGGMAVGGLKVGGRYPKKGQKTKKGRVAYSGYPRKGDLTESGRIAFEDY